MQMTSHKVIIDTDPGIDDAMAILYALGAPGIEVLAITTVAGNIGLDLTTRNAGRLAALAGSGVPVHPGASVPLGHDAQNAADIHGNDGLGGVAFPEPLAPASEVPALQAMTEILLREPAGTVELLCLGPLTNLATLLRAAPEAAARIGRVVAMGGAIDEPGNMGPRAEFNIYFDPEAAGVVLASGLDVTLIPLDATRKFRADAAYIATLKQVGAVATDAVAALLEAYFGASSGAESRPLHDPTVPLYVAHPDLFRIETRALAVEDDGALVPGPHPVKAALGLDAEALRAALKDGLSARS